jgi:hypothetical protein
MNRLTKYFFDSAVNIFTSADAASAVNGSDSSRYGLVKRAMAEGEIVQIRRGLYCLAEHYRKKPLNIFSMAQRIYGPSYVSLESALSYHGWIPEAVYTCTNAGLKNSKEFSTPFGIFSYKRVPQKILYTGVERCLDKHGNVFFIASPLKALADYVYIYKQNDYSLNDIIDSLRIETDELNDIEKEQIDELIDNYSFKRVRTILKEFKRRFAK